MKTIKENFEQNMLDGDKIEDCGGAMLSAESVFEYLSEYVEQILEEIPGRLKRGEGIYFSGKEYIKHLKDLNEHISKILNK